MAANPASSNKGLPLAAVARVSPIYGFSAAIASDMRLAIERRLDHRACSSKEAGTDRRSNRRPRVAASQGDKENGTTQADCRAEVPAELDAAQGQRARRRRR
jgi:hypothetical protein